jgi:hypothetical protein
MRTFIALVVLITILSIVLFSLKLSYGYSQEFMDRTIKVHEENSKLLNKLVSVITTCAERLSSNDTSIVDACSGFELIENNLLKQLFNESRPDIERILLD